MKPTVRSPPPLVSNSRAVTESPVQSPHKTGSHSEVTGSPVRPTPPRETTKEAVKTSVSPVLEADHRTAPPEVCRKEKSSSFRSLLRDDDEEQTGVRSTPRETRNMPLQSLILAAEHRNAPPPPPPTTHHQKEGSLSSASSFKSLSHREAAEDQNGVWSPPRETRKIGESLPLRFLMQAAEHRTAPPPPPPPPHHQKENSLSSASSFKSLSLREAAEEQNGVRSPPRETRKISDSLPLRLLMPAAEHRTAPPLPTHHQKESSLSSASSFKSSSLREAMEDPTASPPADDALALTVASILSSPANVEEERKPVAENRMAAARGTGPSAAVKGKARGTGLRVVREGRHVVRAAGWLRVLALLLSLLSVSVMAADRTSGWAGDSFERYREFRYCFSINVIVFAYSSFQVYMCVHYMCRKQHIMNRHISYYFDFSMDQILAYLLMSASSAAASRNVDWVLSFGSDEFTKMINGSIAMSFLAFFALSFSSLISAYKLFSWNY